MRERFATRDLCLQDLVRRVPRVPSGTRLVCREDGDGGEGTGGRRDDERVYIGPKRR
jgi:hypothetical protein